MHRIIYFSWIRKRGWLGIPYAVLKLRTAHVDEGRFRQMRRGGFSIREMMLLPSEPSRHAV